MTKFTFKVLKLVASSRTGAISSGKGREGVLKRAMEYLVHDAGYGRLQDPAQLRQVHLERVVRAAIDSGMSQRSLHNLLTHLRALEKAIGKPGMLRSNEHYCGPAEPRHNPERKGATPDWRKWAAMQETTAIDKAAKASAAIAMLTGVRLITCVKVDPNRLEAGLLQAKRGEAKGTRPCVTDYRAFMEANNLEHVDAFIRQVAKELGTGAMIPPGRNFIQQYRAVEYRVVQKAGLKSLHNYRHNWARDEYDRKVAERAAASGIPNWVCPVRGGPSQKSLIGVSKRIDLEVREELSQNLGHNRVEITRAYIG